MQMCRFQTKNNSNFYGNRSVFSFGCEIILLRFNCLPSPSVNLGKTENVILLDYARNNFLHNFWIQERRGIANFVRFALGDFA